MSAAPTRAINTLDHYALATERMAQTGTTTAAGAGSTTTVVLTMVGLLVTIALAVAGWIIFDKRRTEDRTADIERTTTSAS